MDTISGTTLEQFSDQIGTVIAGLAGRIAVSTLREEDRERLAEALGTMARIRNVVIEANRGQRAPIPAAYSARIQSIWLAKEMRLSRCVDRLENA